MSELIVNLSSIYNNAKIITQLCKVNNISVCGVVKGCNSLTKVTDVLVEAGCDFIGTSRISQLKDLKAHKTKAPLWMLRIPPISLCDEIIQYSDLSLVSELETLKQLDTLSRYHKKKYKTLLMIDVGDLREGWWPQENLLKLGKELKSLNNIDIVGVGMNASCYGSIVPNEQNTSMVVNTSNQLSNLLDKELLIKSGGNTTSLRLLLSNSLAPGITNLRIGEAILLARDLQDLWKEPVAGTHTDTFTFRAEIIELRSKPSYPIGEVFVDAFANKPAFKDIGIRKKALLYAGKVDFFSPDLLIPMEKGIKVLGASSDHLILDVEDYKGNLKVGSFLEFQLFYGALLSLTNSKDVDIIYKK